MVHINKEQKTNYHISEIFKNNPKLISFFANKEIYYINDISSKCLFEYHKNYYVDVYSNFNLYIKKRVESSSLVKFPKLSYSDYYIISYFLDEKYNYEPIDFNDKEVRKIINSYSKDFDIDKLQKLCVLKKNTLKIGRVDEKKFIRYFYMLIEYYELYAESIESSSDQEEKNILEEKTAKVDFFSNEVKKNLFSFVNNKKMTLKKVYLFFTIIIFDYNFIENNFSFNSLAKQLPFEFDNLIRPLIDNYELEITYQNFWNHFFAINGEIISKNVAEDNTIELVFSNYKPFVNNIISVFTAIDVYDYLNKMHIDENLCIINLITNEILLNQFEKYQIYTLYDFRKLNYQDFMILASADLNLNQFKYLCLLFSDKIETQQYEQFKSYIDDKIDEKSSFVIKERAKGVTLEEIGNNLKLTRERIRQIERKVVNRYKASYSNTTIKVLSLFDLNKEYITKEKLEEIYKDYINVFLMLHKDSYNEKLELLELQDLNAINKQLKRTVKTCLKYNYLHESQVSNLVSSVKSKLHFDISNNYISRYIEKTFYKKGTYLFLTRPTALIQYEVILRHHFGDYDGININNVSAFKDRFYEVFQDKTIYNRSDRAVFTRVIASDDVILINRGVHSIKPDYSNISEETLSNIYSYIKGTKAVHFEVLYNTFKDSLYPTIENRYQLHGLLKFHYKDLYYTKDIVGTEPNPFVDVISIIDSYVHKNKGVINIDKMLKDLPQLAGIHYDFQFSNYNKLISMHNRKMIHIDYITYHEEEMLQLCNEVDSYLSQKEYMHSSDLYNIMLRVAPKTLNENKINNKHYALNYFSHFFDSSYDFYENNITIKGREIKIITLGDIIENFKKTDGFYITELVRNFKEHNVFFQNIKAVLEDIYLNGFMRVNEKVVCKKELILTSSAKKTIKEIEKIFEFYLITNKNIKLSNFDFNILPKIKIEWNKHLLAHSLMAFSTTIKVETIGTQYRLLDYKLTLKGEDKDE